MPSKIVRARDLTVLTLMLPSGSNVVLFIPPPLKNINSCELW
jgi:hypothetical protein